MVLGIIIGIAIGAIIGFIYGGLLSTSKYDDYIDEILKQKEKGNAT